MPTYKFPGLDIVSLRIGIALVLSGLIGLEREFHHRSAGLRTHILVGVSSCLIMMMSVVVAGPGNDPGRIAAQAITGIGFLGAGAIIRDRGGVHGLTTAASIWATCAIGLAVGLGWFTGAAMSAIVTLAVLLLHRLRTSSTDELLE